MPPLKTTFDSKRQENSGYAEPIKVFIDSSLSQKFDGPIFCSSNKLFWTALTGSGRTQLVEAI